MSTKKNKKSRHAANLKRAVAERDGLICWLCEISFASIMDATITIDHYIPRFHGGTNQRENLRLAHRRCNEIRGAMDAAESPAYVKSQLAFGLEHRRRPAPMTRKLAPVTRHDLNLPSPAPARKNRRRQTEPFFHITNDMSWEEKLSMQKQDEDRRPEMSAGKKETA